MVTLKDVQNNEEVKALIEGAQRQLDGLRIYRTLLSPFRNCIEKIRRNLARFRI